MTCIRCHRAIDRWARICPFCNWNQADPPPAREIVPEPVANYKPPEETSVRRKLAFAGAGVLLLIASFVVGVFINSEDAPKQAPATLDEQAANANAAPKPKRAETPLIATNERGGFEQPITSAPADLSNGTLDDYQRKDATAVSAVEYAELARRAKAEKQRQAALIDPRSITGSPYVAPRPRKTLPPPMTSASSEPVANAGSIRTRPVLLDRPLPRIDARGSARLTLLVGSDGRVHEVAIDRALVGNTAQLVAAVQRWRFRPATDNGEPVSSQYTVEISFER